MRESNSKNIRFFLYANFVLFLIVSTGLNQRALAQSDEKIYLVSDEQATFPGGMKAFLTYFQEEMKYPEEAKKEGIASILSVPIIINEKILGAIRVYTSDPWEFTLIDVNFVNALAQIAGMSIRLARYSKGLMSSIEVLKSMREARVHRRTRMTPYEGVPKSFSTEEYRRVHH